MKNKSIDTEFDDEIKFNLKQYLKSGEIIIYDETEQFWSLISNSFHTGLNRLKWEENQLLSSKGTGVKENVWKSLLRKRLLVVGQQHSLLKTFFIVLGDNMIHKGYRMTLVTFIDVFWEFFSIPQHCYIISEDGRYCFNYTFEDDLYFGISPHQKKI